MTFEDFKDEVIISLGGNLVDIELEDRDIQMAFKRAKRTFIQTGANNYRRQFLRLPVSSGVSEYDIPKDIDTVIRVIKPSLGWDVESTSEFALAAYNQLFYRHGQSIASSDYLTYELEKQLIDIYGRYANMETQFDHDRFRNKLRLLRAPRSNRECWIVECYVNLTDEEYMDVWWIQEWSIAEAKEILGQAYRKFSSLAAPTGEVSLNGDGLIQEAKQRKDELKEDLNNQLSGNADFYEITMG